MSTAKKVITYSLVATVITTVTITVASVSWVRGEAKEAAQNETRPLAVEIRALSENVKTLSDSVHDLSKTSRRECE
jgi:cell division protein FtsL